MGDIFGRFIAIVLLVVLFYAQVIGVIFYKTEKAENMYVREVLEEFLFNVTNKGNVIVEEWEKLQCDLERRGRFYNIELSIGKRKEWYREEADKMDDYYFVLYGKDFVKELYEEGVYYFSKGDAVSVTANKSKSNSALKGSAWLLEMFFEKEIIKLGVVV